MKYSYDFHNQNTLETPNKTSNNEELVNIIRKGVKEKREDYKKKFS